MTPTDHTTPAQRTDTTGNIAAAVHVDMQAARIERLEAIISGYEGTLRNIRSRAQKGMLATIPALATHQLEVIDVLAALALMGDGIDPTQTPLEKTHDEP